MILDESFSPRQFKTRMVYQCPNGGAKTIDSDICMDIGIFRFTLFDSISVSCFFMVSLKLDSVFPCVFVHAKSSKTSIIDHCHVVQGASNEFFVSSLMHRTKP